MSRLQNDRKRRNSRKGIVAGIGAANRDVGDRQVAATGVGDDERLRRMAHAEALDDRRREQLIRRQTEAPAPPVAVAWTPIEGFIGSSLAIVSVAV